MIRRSSKSARAKRRPARTVRSIEALESRQLMTITPGMVEFYPGADTAAVTSAMNAPVVLLSDGTMSIVANEFHNRVEVTSASGAWVNNVYYAVDGPASRVEFWGGPGNDDFTNLTSLPTKAWGNAGNDTLRGGFNTNELYGGPGDDTLEGNPFADLLVGDDGVDTLKGYGGPDHLYGGADNDRLEGGPGADLLKGGSGNDVLLGQGDNDSLHGESGHDDLYGGPGNNLLYGGSGVDYMHRGERGFADAGDAPMNEFVPFAGHARALVAMDSYSRVDLMPVLVKTRLFHMDEYWTGFKPNFVNGVLTELSRQSFMGQSLYETFLTMADSGEMQIRDSSSGIELQYRLNGNNLTTYSTQPTELGSWADPRFNVDFDLELTVTLSHAAPIEVLDVHVAIPQATIRGENIAGEVSVFAYQMLSALGAASPEAIQRAMSGISARSFRSVVQDQINAQMKQMNVFPSLAYDAETQMIVLRIERQGELLPSPDPWAKLTEFDPEASATMAFDPSDILGGLGQFSGQTTAVGVTAASDAQSQEVFDRLYTELNATLLSPLDLVALNPQPLPPHELLVADATSMPIAPNWEMIPSLLDFYSDDESMSLDFSAEAYTPDATFEADLAYAEWEGASDDWSIGEDLVDASLFSAELDWALLNPQPLPPSEWITGVDDFWANDLLLNDLRTAMFGDLAGMIF